MLFSHKSLKSFPVYSLKKKSAYMWTYAAQTHVVQGQVYIQEAEK